MRSQEIVSPFSPYGEQGRDIDHRTTNSNKPQDLKDPGTHAKKREWECIKLFY